MMMAVSVGLSAFAAAELKRLDEIKNFILDYPVRSENALLKFKASVAELRRCVGTMSAYAAMEDAKKKLDIQKEAETAYAEGLAALDDYESAVSANAGYGETVRAARLKLSQGVRKLFSEYKERICNPVAAAALAGARGETIEILAVGRGVISSLSGGADSLLESESALIDGQKNESSESARKAAALIALADAGLLTLSVPAALIYCVTYNHIRLRRAGGSVGRRRRIL